MANLFRAVKDKLAAADEKQRQRDIALPNAKQAGRLEYLRTAIAFPWEKNPYGKYLTASATSPVPKGTPSTVIKLGEIKGKGSQPSPSAAPSPPPTPSPNLFRPTAAPRPSPSFMPQSKPPTRPVPTPSPFATPGYRPFTKMAPNWGDILKQTDQVAREYGLPPSVVLAQVAAESARGTHKYSARNNFFNIGAYDSNPDNAFSYGSPAENIKAYAELISKDPRYSKAYAARGNADEYLRLMTEAGYAGDPKTYKKRARNGFNSYIDLIKNTPEYRFYNKR